MSLLKKAGIILLKNISPKLLLESRGSSHGKLSTAITAIELGLLKSEWESKKMTFENKFKNFNIKILYEVSI